MYKYCPKCGSDLVYKRVGENLRLVCKGCGFIFYQNPTPAVGVILMKDDEILLVKRKYEPRAGFWSLPAGFLEWDENVEEAARREVKEETGLEIELDGLFGVYSGFDDPRNHVLLVVYRGQIRNGEIAAGDDATEVKFFPLTALPQDIAFKNHRRVLEKLKAKRKGNSFENRAS
ncbi:MAG: NUDIX domain-containing protein [bacterium]